MTVATEDFSFLADFLRDRSAISIGPDKEYLVESRLTPIARSLGLNDVTSLIGELRRPFPNPEVKQKVIEAMTTNETSFFRDVHPFESLRHEIIPEIMERNNAIRRLRIWSAASSTGQELYSIAMMLDTHFPELATWDLTLLGTDLSTEVTTKAKKGHFSALEVNRGLPAPMLVRYFTREGAEYVIDERLRNRVKFENMNLAEPFPALPMFDIIMCRNVLIYFELDVRRSILERMRRVLAPGGYLFLGSSETTVGLIDDFTPVRSGGTTVYRVEA